MSTTMASSLNVFGEKLIPCNEAPMTGYFRDGCCNTSEQDAGSHTICASVTAEFLTFSKSEGNDLSTPRPEFGFVGLRPGDSWCLCAARWLTAYKNDAAPHIHLMRTHQLALEIVPMETMKAFAADLN